MAQPEEKKKAFRINAKRFFLTYPRCNIEPTVLLSELRKKGKIVQYVIGKEKHAEEDPLLGDYHLHACIAYAKKLNIKDDKSFDIMGFHPHVESVKNWHQCAAYCSKDGDYIEAMEFDYSTPDNYRKRKADFDSWKKDRECAQQLEVNWPIVLPDGKTQWAPIGKKRGLWIVGPADSGKTTWFRRTFDTPNYRYFTANAQPYVFENYAEQQVLLFDDRDPTLEQVKACINHHGRQHSVGASRFTQYYWKYTGDFYCVMIVLSNNVPSFSEDDAFKARFDILFIQ